MIIDFRIHIGNSLFGCSNSTLDVLTGMTRLGIAGAVVCPVKPLQYHYTVSNRDVFQTVQNYSERFYQFARIDPWQGVGALEELNVCVEQYEVKGLFLHPWEEQFRINDVIVDPIMDFAEEKNLIVMIAAGYVRFSKALQVAELVKRYPKVRFVVTSGGQINIAGAGLREAEALLKEHPQILMETSGIYRQDFIEKIAKECGPHRILFGSGSPEFDQDLELKRVQWLNLSDENRHAILGGNATRLLGI